MDRAKELLDVVEVTHFRKDHWPLPCFLSAASVWAQKPDTPPTPATMPASQGGVAPFDMTGFIQFASVDSVCTRNDNRLADESADASGVQIGGRLDPGQWPRDPSPAEHDSADARKHADLGRSFRVQLAGLRNGERTGAFRRLASARDI